jgi:hypothetical protein
MAIRANAVTTANPLRRDRRERNDPIMHASGAVTAAGRGWLFAGKR